MGNLKEECGVFGVFSREPYDVARMTYYGLFALQHRGQESAGIVVNDDGLFRTHKDAGTVEEVFSAPVFEKLGLGNMAVGHVRYGTAETKERINAQPMVINHIKGKMAIANNGTLVNALALREELELTGSIFHTASDAEVIAYLITRERLTAPSIEVAVERAVAHLVGSFSLLVMSPKKLVAVRDPWGFHPLCYGQTADGRIVIASESCALDSVGATLCRDLAPGEIIVVDENGIRSITTHVGSRPHAKCVFEYIYFARPDSCIDGTTVHSARLAAGAALAKEHPVEADVVIGVPDSGLDAAIGYAKESGIPYEIGFIKNKYIGRTFIAPGQANREDKVRIKLNPIAEVVRGKRVVLVDDSIVRGTTGGRIVQLLRDAGAKEIHMRISSPPFLNPCYYGTDIDSRDHLIACKHTAEEIARIMNADSLGYLSLDSAKRLAGEENACEFCTACFDGKYPTDVPEVKPVCKYERKISEGKK
ncbi:MAG: amidophosphoribosyltransferase [Clostridia bacterium]|nr:amidophosphoribosyltransferase [Clostridia bacterium]